MTPDKKTAQRGNNQYEIRNTIFRLLKIRERSVKEIQDKLKTKNYLKEEIDESIHYFLNLDLLNDRRFTEQWIRWRLSKPYGFKRIFFELKLKGIDDETIHTAMTAAKSSQDEEKTIYDLAVRRLKKYQNIDDEKTIQRLYGYLYRRGFNSAIINKTLNKIRTELENK